MDLLTGEAVYKKAGMDGNFNNPLEKCNTASCIKEDRRFLLKTHALAPEPTSIRINGKKMTAIGSEIKQTGVVRAKTMFWKQKK